MFCMTSKKTPRKGSTLAEGREQVVLIIDSDVLAAIEEHAQSMRLKRNALIQLALIEYLKSKGEWPLRTQE